MGTVEAHHPLRNAHRAGVWLHHAGAGRDRTSPRALNGLGLDDDTRMHTAVTLFAYVRGHAIDLEPESEAAAPAA
ncbi:hypothetical protein [Streptomyces sp. NPDC001717]|uniref:hypothetical protein n=1 Tax=Streptomyces sp. NPDC001717 TaxID=3364604 RepID=UPI00369FD98F